MEDRSKFSITVEDFSLFPVPNWARIETYHLDFRKLLRGNLSPDDTVSLTVPLGVFLANPDLPQRCNNIVLRTDDTNLSIVLENTRRFRSTISHCTLSPNQTDSSLMVILPSLGIPITLLPYEDWRQDDIDTISDYFLFSPSLNVRIEPFFSLVPSMNGDGLNMWDIFQERLGNTFYIDVRNRVTLSERWAKENVFFGEARDDPNRMPGTQEWRQIEDLHTDLFSALTECSTCQHYHFCHGFFKAVNRQRDCTLWRSAFSKVVETYLSYNQRTAGIE